ncbi:N-6 DNA methylase [Nocardia altamirensis]|uniref:N-6 DNA methylase n=1 Tax=Nocardia altamirensis TaxID=472158 RepID=UPI00084006BE|nr:N-6 DNA methylase [Nocardia altamirensis]
MTGTTERCHHIAEQVCRAWNTTASHACERIDIALGTVATLCLRWPVEHPSPEEVERARLWWRGLDDDALIACLRRVWAVFWLAEPYLVETAKPLRAWLDEPSDPKITAGVRAVIDAALHAGLTEITGYPHAPDRSSADLLGTVLIYLRSSGARDGLAEFPTPPDAAALISELVLRPDRLIESTPPPAGARIGDDAAGTGGLILSTAQHFRAHGAEPADYCWYLAEVNPLAGAGAAINAILWGLGPNVLIYIGDTLTTVDGVALAADERRSVLAHHAHIAQGFRYAKAARDVLRLTDTTPAAEQAGS